MKESFASLMSALGSTYTGYVVGSGLSFAKHSAIASCFLRRCPPLKLSLIILQRVTFMGFFVPYLKELKMSANGTRRSDFDEKKAGDVNSKTSRHGLKTRHDVFRTKAPESAIARLSTDPAMATYCEGHSFLSP